MVEFSNKDYNYWKQKKTKPQKKKKPFSSFTSMNMLKKLKKVVLPLKSHSLNDPFGLKHSSHKPTGKS